MAKKDPFDDDSTADDKTADRAAVESFKEKVAEKREAAAEGEIEVDVDRAEDELKDVPEPIERSRQQKRQDRYRAMQEERDAAQREREEMKTRLSQMEQMLHQQRQPPPQQPQKPETDPLDEKLQKTFAEQDMLYRDFNARQGQMSPQEVEAFNTRARALQREMMLTSAEIAMAKQGVKPVDEQQVRNQILREQLMREHGDVLGDPRKGDFCQGAWMQLRAKGRPDDWATIAEAADMTRREFGMRTKNAKPPSESYKRKLTGTARGAGPSEGGGQMVTMNAHQKAMADAAFKHIKNEKERYQRWAAGPGRRLAEKQSG
jgi:hypothetical protein